MSEMLDKEKEEDARQKMIADIEGKQRRKIKARKNHDRGIWFGLGMIGTVGWAIVLPTLLGLALGIWIDRTWPSVISWRLVLMIVGVIVGSFNAFWWVLREQKNIEAENREDQDDIK